MNPTTTDLAPTPGEALCTLAGAFIDAARKRFGVEIAEVPFDAPRRPEFGDVATNLAFGLAKAARSAPQAIAEVLIADAVTARPEIAALLANAEAVAGFINLRLAPRCWQRVVGNVLREGAHYGESATRGERISLEFGSANPTGPLVVVQGRALSIGATLAAAMRACGYDVFVEWIVNDAGSQLDTLARSLYARYRQIAEPSFPFPDDGYPGDYLLPIARSLRDEFGAGFDAAPEAEWLPMFAKRGRDALVAQQQHTVERFGIHYDLWQSERELHDAGKVQAGIERLRELGLTYERDGALYFRATQFGDDKDRVLIKSDGKPTYLAPDVAYHFEKLQRADRVIDLLGPDHHGYIGRLRGLATALGYDGKLEVAIAQQVTLLRGGKQVAMSKRAGDIVTLDAILDEVGVDAARFFFAMLATETPLAFDLQLATEQSNENPVYYVQYGHARIASVLRNADAGELAEARRAELLGALTHVSEIALMRRLEEYPSTLRSVVAALSPHRLARYARDVASDFHAFYGECRILTENRAERIARLALAAATQHVLANALRILGVSAPEAMERISEQ
ncbi:MAG TPA: arginine--tRNA ligase [Candidatus Dormibacteraeota bacterium]|nr:arginine--tRNA ligase [Candidatus Dormibacteraeota bacterium]